MSSLFLFTGQNTFRLGEEKRLWVAEFTKKHGPENLVRLDAKELSFRHLLDEISTAPFIAEKRLVVVDGIPSFSKEEIERLPSMIHPATVLLFVEPSPDKRLSTVKAFLKVAEVKEFSKLSRPAMQSWAESFSRAAGTSLQPSVFMKLLEVVGDDQETLSREIQKLSAFAMTRPVTQDDVRLLAVPSGEQQVWTLTNLIAEEKAADALLYAESLLARGEDPFSLWNILLWFLKNLVLVAASVEDGEHNPATIASQAGVPFLSVKTLLPLCRSIDRVSLMRLLDWAVDADTELKTGGYRVSGDAPQELFALIDAFILRCAHMRRSAAARPALRRG